MKLARFVLTLGRRPRVNKPCGFGPVPVYSGNHVMGNIKQTH